MEQQTQRPGRYLPGQAPLEWNLSQNIAAMATAFFNNVLQISEVDIRRRQQNIMESELQHLISKYERSVEHQERMYAMEYVKSIVDVTDFDKMNDNVLREQVYQKYSSLLPEGTEPLQTDIDIVFHHLQSERNKNFEMYRSNVNEITSKIKGDNRLLALWKQDNDGDRDLVLRESIAGIRRSIPESLYPKLTEDIQGRISTPDRLAPQPKPQPAATTEETSSPQEEQPVINRTRSVEEFFSSFER